MRRPIYKCKIYGNESDLKELIAQLENWYTLVVTSDFEDSGNTKHPKYVYFSILEKREQMWDT